MQTPPRDTRPQDTTERTGFGLYAAHLLTIGGLALSNAFLGLVILWGGFRRRHLAWDWPVTCPLLIPLGFYLIFFLVSTLTSVDALTSAGQLKEVFALATVPLGMVLVRGEHAVRRLVDLLILLMVAFAGYGIGQSYIGDFGTLHSRPPGPFSHYMTYSGVLLIGELLLVGRMAGGGWRKWWTWPALLVVSWALLLTLTRGAWVAAALTLSALVLLHLRRAYVLPVVATALLFGAAFARLAPDPWTERIRSIADLRDVSNYDRLCMIDAGLFMISERPLFGIGPEMVKNRYPIYRHPTAPRFDAPHLHNAYLQIAAEQGLLSLGVYCWLLGAALGLGYRGYRRDGGASGPRADLYLASLLTIAGFAIAGLFEDNWRDTEVQRLVLFLMAIPCCLRPDLLNYRDE